MQSVARTLWWVNHLHLDELVRLLSVVSMMRWVCLGELDQPAYAELRMMIAIPTAISSLV
jgi:hypothetical protein